MTIHIHIINVREARGKAMSGFHGRFLMEVGFMWSEASEAVLMYYFVFVYDADAIS